MSTNNFRESASVRALGLTLLFGPLLFILIFGSLKFWSTNHANFILSEQIALQNQNPYPPRIAAKKKHVVKSHAPVPENSTFSAFEPESPAETPDSHRALRSTTATPTETVDTPEGVELKASNGTEHSPYLTGAPVIQAVSSIGLSLKIPLQGATHYR